MKKKTIADLVTELGIVGAANEVGVDTSTIHRWASGESKPRGAAVRRALKQLGVVI